MLRQTGWLTEELFRKLFQLFLSCAKLSER